MNIFINLPVYLQIFKCENDTLARVNSLIFYLICCFSPFFCTSQLQHSLFGIYLWYTNGGNDHILFDNGTSAVGKSIDWRKYRASNRIGEIKKKGKHTQIHTQFMTSWYDIFGLYWLRWVDVQPVECSVEWYTPYYRSYTLMLIYC